MRHPLYDSRRRGDTRSPDPKEEYTKMADLCEYKTKRCNATADHPIESMLPGGILDSVWLCCKHAQCECDATLQLVGGKWVMVNPHRK
jgi:hypothetical protein